MLQRITKIIKRVLLRSPAITVGLLCFLVLITIAITSVQATNAAEKKTAMQDAIMRSALHCYSLEGAYPTDLAYLEEHYNLAINRDTYIVHYELFASNIAPDITVIAKAQAEGGTT